MPAPWPEIVGTVTLLSVGPVVDKLILRRHKVKIHDRLTDYWIKLAYARVPELPVIIARKALTIITRGFGGKRISGRALIHYLGLSLALTAVALVIGLVRTSDIAHAFGALDRKTAEQVFGVRKNDWFLDALPSLRTYDPLALLIHHPKWLALLAAYNFVLDFISIASTVIFLHAIVRFGSRYALFFTALALGASYYCSQKSYAVSIGVCSSALLDPLRSPTKAGLSGEQMALAMTTLVVSMPYSMTTLAPTGVFLALLAVACAARAVLPISRILGLHMLERLTEEKPDSAMPATILTSALWLVFAVGLAMIRGTEYVREHRATASHAPAPAPAQGSK